MEKDSGELKMVKNAFIMLLGLVCISCNSTKTEIDKRCQSGVVLVYHVDYYSLTLPNGIILYFSGDADGNITNVSFDEDDIEKSMGIGTGFFISKDGKIATNKHVAARTLSDRSIRRLTKQIVNMIVDELKNQNKVAEQLQQQFAYQYNNSNDASEKAKLKQNYNDLGEEIEKNIKITKELERSDVEGADIEYHNEFLGIAYNGTFVKTMEDFYPCTLRDTSSYDLAIIQLNSKETPKGRYVFQIPSKNMLEHYSFGEYISRLSGSDKNEELLLIGFNKGLTIGQTEEGVFSQCMDGSISLDEKDRILYSIATLPGSSGSPVLNRRGQLVAVNYAGYSQTQSFNLGIKAIHLTELVQKKQ